MDFSVFKQMMILFFMMLTGFIANKTGVMGPESEQRLSKLVVNITCPALILSSVTSCDRLESSAMLTVIFLTAIGYYLLLPPLSKVLVRFLPIEPARRKEYEAMLIYSNLGFMGIPVVSSVLGDQAILYLSIFMAVFNLSVFSYGSLLLQNSGSKAPSFAKMVNPGTVSALSAIILYLCGLTLPPIIKESVSSIGSVTTPLAMLIIGSSLANQPFREMLAEKGLLPFALVRLGILPLISLVVGRFLISDNMLLCVLVISSAMPVASNIVMLRKEAGEDDSCLTRGVFLTTLLSVVTIPLISSLLSWMGLC